MERTDWVWMDGGLVPWEEARIHVATDAVLQGDNVFEGIRAYWNDEQQELFVFRNQAHLHRLRQSAKIMRLTIPYSDAELTAASNELLRANAFHDHVHFRIVAYFGEGERGAWTPDKVRTGVFMLAQLSPHAAAVFEGVNSCTSTWRRLSDLSSPPRVKSGANYHNSRFARMEALLNGFDHPIMLNERGKVSETPGSCFFMLRDGIPATPPVTADILESITRTTLIQLFRDEQNIEVQEREIDRTEVYLADEAFLCGTGEEIRPVLSVDHYELGYGNIGPVTQRLQKRYFDIVEGRVQKYSSWLTPVYQSAALAAPVKH